MTIDVTNKIKSKINEITNEKLEQEKQNEFNIAQETICKIMDVFKIERPSKELMEIVIRATFESFKRGYDIGFKVADEFYFGK